MKDTSDSEIEAIRSVVNALEPLPQAARANVIEYVTKRFDICSTAQPLRQKRGLSTASKIILLLFFSGFALLVAAIAIPNIVMAKKRAATNGCIANLKQIEGAKVTWALENKKTNGTDVVVDMNLFGSAAYIRIKPKCPEGGTYVLGTMGEEPRCSIPGHALP